jgi:hypothetical protein
MAEKESLGGATLEVDAGLWVVSGEAFELWPGAGVDLDGREESLVNSLQRYWQ